MTKNDKHFINISEETEIDRPANREMFLVEKIDWRRIKRLIKKIDASGNKFYNVGWFMSATTIVFLIEFSNLLLVRDKYGMYFLIVFFFSLIVTLILFFVGQKIDKLSHGSKEEVLLEMEQVENKTIK